MDNKTNKHEFACNAGKVTEYEVKEHIDTIMVGFRGFSKEVSIVKWNDKKPVFDIRAWRVSDRDGLQYPLRGITFSKEEFIKLREILNSIDVNDKILKPNRNSSGYVRVPLYNDENEYKQTLVHRLVYMAHVGPIPKGMQINHKDEDKTNNCIENLEVVTPKQNIHYGSASIRRSESVKRYWQEKRKMAAC